MLIKSKIRVGASLVALNQYLKDQEKNENECGGILAYIGA